ncbi:DUF3037 domain-containing protein [Marinobacterium arenosum]|uniref:DUF3037 domain-containing protein n=1 Tax=Marinobacterium arenosum TaxID=2862496 RepID=UPI001C965BB0|nr:DUF3037 domain-containing protein [Marinobacterium arenosum]MBY4676812.1 DUF3037 domain-containing protein [Marinobacterium arenosum]
MKKFACQYKIIRFAPFVETEEFANIGVAVYCPANGLLEYRLAQPRFGRVTSFFHDMDPAVYRAARESLDRELGRTKELLSQLSDVELGKQVFNELTREKGGLVRFSSFRAILTPKVSLKADQLFDHYVGRSFNNKEYREVTLERRVREQLKQFNLDKAYKKAKLGGGLIEVNLPFVKIRNGKPLAAIKPIAFDQKTRTKMVEHADTWLSRAEHLLDGELPAEGLLLALDYESIGDKQVERYVTNVQRKLNEMGVTTIKGVVEKEIVAFAKAHNGSKTPETDGVPEIAH